MENGLTIAAHDELLLSSFTLTDGRYVEPVVKKVAAMQLPVSEETDPTKLQEQRRKTEISLLKSGLRCDVEEAFRMTPEELLRHAHDTLALRVSRIRDVRYMSEFDREEIFKIIFDTDMFLGNSGIDPDVQYRHHLESLNLLDESEAFKYIFFDIEFQGCLIRQLPRLNGKVYGEKTVAKDITEPDYIALIHKAWSEAKTPLEKMEVFLVLYQNIMIRRHTVVSHTIRAAVFMGSAQRFGNIVERTMGNTDPESFLQAVADELTDYHLGHMRNVVETGQGTKLMSIVIRNELEKALGDNLPMALCHPETSLLSAGFALHRVRHAIPDPNAEQYRSQVRRDIEASIRDGSLAKLDISAETVGVELLIAKIAEPMRQAAKDIAESVEKAERPFKGYYPVGAKVHFREAVSGEKLQSLFDTFRFSTSQFRMLHADTSMLIPPRKSATEIVAILEELKRRGIIGEHSEIQTCIPGRLNNQYAAILGSSMLLSSFLCVTYDRSSFQTTHNEQTASMIMAYDGGTLDRSVADLPEALTGRTDMLGRKDVRDVYLYQILGSLISQAAYGGPLKDVGRKFIQEYLELLERDGMLEILGAQWINDEHSVVEPDTEGHYLAVKRCTDIWLGDNARYQATGSPEGLSFDVLRLLTKSLEEVKMTQVKLGLVEADATSLTLLHSNI